EVYSGGFYVFIDPRLGDHAAVSDQHDVSNPETLLHLLDLSRQRRRIANIAFENLDRHRTSLCRAHKAEHDLKLVAFAIAIVAAFGQRARATLKIGRGDVVKNEGAVLEVTPRQLGHDPAGRHLLGAS